MGEYNSENNFQAASKPEVYKTCLPSLDNPKSKINKRKVKFSEDDISLTFSVYGKPSFKCNGHKVPSLKKLTECAVNKTKIISGSNCQRVFNGLGSSACSHDKSNHKNVCQEPSIIFLNKLDPKFRQHSFSNKVWVNIWRNNYEYRCYSHRNFYLLRQRFMLEINTYRSAHRSPPLTEDYYLSKVAQDRAEKIASSGKVNTEKNEDYEEIVGVTDIFMAPFMVKQWYQEVNKYNFVTPFLTRNSKNFVKMIWKKTTYLGIGIVKRNCDLYIVLKFKKRKRKLIGLLSNVRTLKKNN
uniref:SCP domain-containing protein n=1 Tax=Strongyloides papillosus TaxID=174720 RepID=A0A0N5BV76_STREA